MCSDRFLGEEFLGKRRLGISILFLVDFSTLFWKWHLPRSATHFEYEWNILLSLFHRAGFQFTFLSGPVILNATRRVRLWFISPHQGVCRNATRAFCFYSNQFGLGVFPKRLTGRCRRGVDNVGAFARPQIWRGLILKSDFASVVGFCLGRAPFGWLSWPITCHICCSNLSSICMRWKIFFSLSGLNSGYTVWIPGQRMITIRNHSGRYDLLSARFIREILPSFSSFSPLSLIYWI